MCLALHREDPGVAAVGAEQVRETLALFERDRGRGRAVVAEVGDRLAGYSLLVPYWSNEQGGEICEVDELYVRAERRGEGLGSALFAAIDGGSLGVCRRRLGGGARERPGAAPLRAAGVPRGRDDHIPPAVRPDSGRHVLAGGDS